MMHMLSNACAKWCQTSLQVKQQLPWWRERWHRQTVRTKIQAYCFAYGPHHIKIQKLNQCQINKLWDLEARAGAFLDREIFKWERNSNTHTHINTQTYTNTNKDTHYYTNTHTHSLIHTNHDCLDACHLLHYRNQDAHDQTQAHAHSITHSLTQH